VEIGELEALREAGTEHLFRGRYNGRPETLRGSVIAVEFRGIPNLVIVGTPSGVQRSWDARTMTVNP
jgi:hypothetical protein